MKRSRVLVRIGCLGLALCAAASVSGQGFVRTAPEQVKWVDEPDGHRRLLAGLHERAQHAERGQHAEAPVEPAARRHRVEVRADDHEAKPPAAPSRRPWKPAARSRNPAGPPKYRTNANSRVATPESETWGAHARFAQPRRRSRRLAQWHEPPGRKSTSGREANRPARGPRRSTANS